MRIVFSIHATAYFARALEKFLIVQTSRRKNRESGMCRNHNKQTMYSENFLSLR